MVRILAVLSCFGLVAGAQQGPSAGKQDAPKLAHTSQDPFKCKACAPALQKAYQYLDKNSGQADGYRHILMGFVWLVDGQHPEELKRSINAASGGFYKQDSFNRNWATCMSAIFLSEVYKRQPTEKIRSTLLDILKVAETQQEATGGWCHHLGFAAESGYNKRGGGVDLGILTCMMFGAMLNMKACGIDVPPKMIEKVQANLESLSDGQGVGYGTDNKWGDIAMGRASWAYLGIHFAKHTATKLAKGIPQGLRSRCKDTDKGHAYPPVHYSSVAMASHLCGPEAYDKFFAHWVDRLIALQKEDGSVELPHSEGKEYQKQDKFLGGTASFALILLLQQPGALERGIPKGKRGAPAPEAGNGGTATSAVADGKPWLGMRVKRDGFGLTVWSTASGSPAEAAGLKEGDLLSDVNGRAVDTLEAFRKLLADKKPGAKLKVNFMRLGERKTLEVTVGAEPSSKQAPSEDEGEEI